MATVGGNLFAPAPYGDFAVALLALDATVSTDDGETADREPSWPRATGSRAIVTSVGFTLPTQDGFRFLKVSRVKPKGVSVLSIAAVLEQAPDGTVSSARIALGCMADRPMRAKAAEKALIGRSADQGRHRAGVGCRRRRHLADHRSDRQRLVSQRSAAGPSRPAAARPEITVGGARLSDRSGRRARRKHGKGPGPVHAQRL